MTKKQRAEQAVQLLKEKYPLAECSLEYRHPYELLISTRLSAQCTDARVNIVTKELFGRYDTLEKLANAEYEDILAIVKPCGLGNTKAKDVIGIAKGLLKRFGGQVPATMEELTSLPGVGRKTANLILGDVFHLPAIVTDTHCIRICGRLGLTDSTNPAVVEKQLKAIVPPQEGSDFCHRLVHFGREVCKAQKPVCEECTLRAICKNPPKPKPGKAASTAKKASSK